MCGIVGMHNGRSDSLITEMLSSVLHRGPDGRGKWLNEREGLGHSRLSIIDLETGAQPMSDAGNRRHVAFNGEIYNYRDLRRQLGEGRFRTKSDTEVILELAANGDRPEQWVRKLDGMFAFALIEDGALLLARDPLGIKPLYLGERDGALLFASELKALSDVAERISEFPPGHIYSSKEGLRPYWQIQPHAEKISDASEAAAGIHDRLQKAVRKRLIADVPVGVFLSGGLDSSMIAAVARQHKDPLDSFAVGTGESEDLRYARHAADFIGTRHHEYIYTMKEAVEALPEVIYYLESFDCALVRSAVPNYLLARLARKHVKVALSGEGADELFAGYEYLRSIELGALDAELLHITRALHNTNLQRCDRMSMAHGLEVRVPFLDVEMVDYAFRLSGHLKQHGAERTEKWILRRVAERLLPPEITRRKKLKFAAGAGLGERLAQFAEREISDAAFAGKREIADGLFAQSKEELFYYLIFRQVYPHGDLIPLVGRSRSI